MNNSNLSAKVYDDIKVMLIGIVFPPGSYLSEQTLADKLGVSRTPVREALQRLSHEGWVQIGERKRILVSPVTPQDIEELFLLRSILEPYAAKDTLAKGKSRVLAGKLDEVVEQMDAVSKNRMAFARLDMQFHSLIVGNIGSPRLDRFWQTLHEETSRLAVMNLTDRNRPGIVIQEHKRMVDAFWMKDLEQILNAILEHIFKSRDALMTKLSVSGLNKKNTKKQQGFEGIDAETFDCISDVSESVSFEGGQDDIQFCDGKEGA